ncbi:MAG: DNA adenine methylase [Deltaproteobacteria bacterium]|nr:DNA adenine methylase [Deltaproteobacteria bacterium]
MEAKAITELDGMKGDVNGMSREALWYEDATLHYRYHLLKAYGQKSEGWSGEDMVELHARIAKELERQGAAHFERDDDLDRDTETFLKQFTVDSGDADDDEPPPMIAWIQERESVEQEDEIDEAFEKANYVGNKRRLSKYIVGKFPDGGKSIFDPMCGCSAILIEAARKGYRVKGNDLSIVPFWYSKGVFEGAQLSEADIEKLKNAAPHDGWLTTGWKGVYPRPRNIRRYLDGLAKKARQWQGAKGLAAKAVASRVLQTLYSDSISGYSTIRYETEDAVKRIVDRSAKEVNGLIAEVSGKGTITNSNAVSMSYPWADVVYFDPPFFKRDKGYVHYFQTYKVMNSILLGSEWKEANLKPEDIPPVLEKLCRSCRHIYISTSSNEVVPYAKELSRHKKTMKRFRVTYTQTSGFGSRDDQQREHLYVAKQDGAEEDDLGEIEKRRLVPFNQWGGSSKYAGALAKRLPEHKRYAEPFCGSGGVFFAKDAAQEEMLADTDPEVVFALRFIQRMSKQSFAALKRFPWTVSRAGFERVKQAKPQSDAERFWKHVFSRQCTWGGKPKASGFSTISDGKTYSLDDLWKFKERLKDARIVSQDWKKTIADFDGPDTLFFIDPPYVDEWAHGEGIPPEEIAEAVGKLKGEFVVAYTDSARARKALSKAGKLFKMKIPETRHSGLWKKSNRLFAASAGIKKELDDEFVEDIA